MAEHIGSNIYKLRMAKGLTQAQLAKGICDRSHISMIEAGRSTPSIPLLEKISIKLQMTLSDLLGDVTIQSQESSYSFDLLIEHIETLISEQQSLDGSILIRKYIRHPDISESPGKLAILLRYSGILEAMRQQFDRAEAALLKAQQYAQQSRNQQILVDVNISLGALQNHMSNYRESEAIYNETLSHAPKGLPLSTLTKLHYGLAVALQGQGKLQQAVRILKSRLEQLLKNNSMFLYGEISALIAMCYEKMNHHREAIAYYEKVVAYHTFRGTTKQVSHTYRKIADCYQALDNLENFQKYEQLASGAQKESLLLTSTYNVLAF